METKQTYAQAMASQRNLAKANHAKKKMAEARRAAAEANAAKTPATKEFEARYEAARKAYNAAPTFENFQTLNNMRKER